MIRRSVHRPLWREAREPLREGACGAVVESGWRGNERAHLTTSRRAGSPLDDTGCATEARCVMARAPCVSAGDAPIDGSWGKS